MRPHTSREGAPSCHPFCNPNSRPGEAAGPHLPLLHHMPGLPTAVLSCPELKSRTCDTEDLLCLLFPSPLASVRTLDTVQKEAAGSCPESRKVLPLGQPESLPGDREACAGGAPAAVSGGVCAHGAHVLRPTHPPAHPWGSLAGRGWLTGHGNRGICDPVTPKKIEKDCKIIKL